MLLRPSAPDPRPRSPWSSSASTSGTSTPDALPAGASTPLPHDNIVSRLPRASEHAPLPPPPQAVSVCARASYLKPSYWLSALIPNPSQRRIRIRVMSAPRRVLGPSRPLGPAPAPAHLNGSDALPRPPQQLTQSQSSANIPMGAQRLNS
jgi:hypothetical protein